MVRILMEDNQHLTKAQRAAHAICEQHQDFATASVLKTTIDETERRRWFLCEIAQGQIYAIERPTHSLTGYDS